MLGRRAFIAGGAAALPFLAAPVSGAVRTIRVSATPSIFKSMFEALCREFQREHPGIVVELSATSRDQDEEFFKTLRRALIHDLPDVSFQSFYHLRTLQRRGITVPLNGLIANEPAWTRASYDDSLTEIGSVGPAVMGLGAAVSLPIVYYNADRVTPLLGSKPFPGGWPDILALVERLAREARPGELGGYCQHPHGGWIYMGMIESAGGRLVDAQGNPAIFESPQSRRALEIYRAFGRAGQARALMGNDQARQAFAGGTIAVLVDSSSSLAAFERQIGGRFRLGTARLPVVSAGRIPVSGIASVLMTRDGVRQQAAWQFMKFVSGPAGQIIIGRSSGYFPANTAVVRRADWLGSYYDSRALTRAVTESMPFAGRPYEFPGNNSSKIYSVISDHVESVITLSRTPAEALDSMKRSVDALLPARGDITGAISEEKQ